MGLRVLGGIVVLLLFWAAFEYGRYRGGFDALAEAEVRAAMAGRIADLTAERDGLRRRVAAIERASRVDQQAYADIKRRLADEQAEMQELRQEVAFYRAFVDDGGKHRGLYIQNLQLQPDPEQGGYRYRLILTRYMERKRLARGEVVIVLEGRRGGRESRIEIDGQAQRNRFRFRYFQEVSGHMTIPEGFVPERVVVRAVPRGRGHGPTVERTFVWKDLLVEG